MCSFLVSGFCDCVGGFKFLGVGRVVFEVYVAGIYLE